MGGGPGAANAKSRKRSNNLYLSRICSAGEILSKNPTPESVSIMHLATILALVLGASALPSESNAADTAAELDSRAIGSSCKYSVSPISLPHPSPC